MGRHHLTDPFLRFYYRFIAPERAEVGYRPEEVLPGIEAQLRAFVGTTAFEDLCRLWVDLAAALPAKRQAKLPFVPEHIGSHWSRKVQADVVAVNWREKAILIGECKWGADEVGRDVLRELIEKKGALVRSAARRRERLENALRAVQPHRVHAGRAGVGTGASRAAGRAGADGPRFRGGGRMIVVQHRLSGGVGMLLQFHSRRPTAPRAAGSSFVDRAHPTQTGQFLCESRVASPRESC